MKKYPEQSDFYPVIDESFIDTDAVYVCVIGPRLPGKQFAERLIKCLEALYEEAQEK